MDLREVLYHIIRSDGSCTSGQSVDLAEKIHNFLTKNFNMEELSFNEEKILYAIAITNALGNEEYLWSERGDDCYTDDIGNSILSETIEGLPQVQRNEYIVKVSNNEENGLYVIGKAD